LTDESRGKMEFTQRGERYRNREQDTITIKEREREKEREGKKIWKIQKLSKNNKFT